MSDSKALESACSAAVIAVSPDPGRATELSGIELSGIEWSGDEARAIELSGIELRGAEAASPEPRTCRAAYRGGGNDRLGHGLDAGDGRRARREGCADRHDVR